LLQQLMPILKKILQSENKDDIRYSINDIQNIYYNENSSNNTQDAYNKPIYIIEKELGEKFINSWKYKYNKYKYGIKCNNGDINVDCKTSNDADVDTKYLVDYNCNINNNNINYNE